ncbi:hypothetical protein [Alteromonas gracilis]|uniref:hypothetical protein n=1 Tax=Alteromonas gracilis TaxID=1479524 RepID=UPI0032196E87
MLSISTYVKSLLLLMVLIAPVKTYAGFILFTDRDAWEAAVTSPFAQSTARQDLAHLML